MLLPSLAFLSIKPLKVIQKSYKTKKPEAAVIQPSTRQTRGQRSAAHAFGYRGAHRGEMPPGESKGVNRGASHGKRHRGECPGEVLEFKESIFLRGRPVPAGCRGRGDFATVIRLGVPRFKRSLFFGKGDLMHGLTSARVVSFYFGRLVPAHHFRENHMTWFSLAALTFLESRTRQVCPLFGAKLPTDRRPRPGECNAGELPARHLISVTRHHRCEASPRVWRVLQA